MLKNRTTPLPLHHGTPAGANGNPMNAALEKGLNLVGLAATKTGSGEKERAYVVKQNSVLKALLCIVTLAVCVLIVVFSTVLELKVARRGLIISETMHHKKEHHDHEDLLKTSLELQEALQSTIEETQLIEEFRAFFDKSAGKSDDIIDSIFADAGVPAKTLDKAKKLQREFVKEIEKRLGQILNRFHSKAVTARAQVTKLAKMMGHEIDTDARDTKRYMEKLEELGVDDEYAEKLEEAYEEEDDEEEEVDPEPETEEEKKMTKEELKKKREEEEKAEQRELEEQLDNFFKKIQAMTMPSIPLDKIPVIEQAFREMQTTLEDETKETDLELVNKKMEKVIQEAAPGTLAEKFDNDKHDSLIDFYDSFIERAKLAPHKQTLIDLYNGWKAPGSSITAFTVLAELENVIAQEHLTRVFDLLENMDIDPHTDTEEDHESEDSGSLSEGDAADAQRLSRRRASNEKRKITKSNTDEENKPAAEIKSEEQAVSGGGDTAAATSEEAKKD